MNNPRLQNDPENYFVTTVGAPHGTCYGNGWSFGAWTTVACDAASSVPTNALFSVLMLSGGRPGERYGFAWSEQAAPTLDTDFTPTSSYQRTSSGAAITMRRTGTGQYTVTVPGLAPGAHYPTVQVKPYATPVTDCKASTPSPALNGVDAIVTVSCENRYSHAPTDARFTIVILD